MKRNKIFGAIALVVLLITGSCSTSNDVVSNGFIQKRKYTKGFHVSDKNMTASLKKNKNEKTDTPAQESKQIEPENITASIETVSNESNIIKEMKTVPVTENIQKGNENVSVAVEKDVNDIEESVNEKGHETIMFESNKIEKSSVKQTKIKKKSTSGDSMLILLVILAFLIPFVAVGIKTDWDIVKVLICLLLSILFWLPGIIYALLVVFDVI